MEKPSEKSLQSQHLPFRLTYLIILLGISSGAKLGWYVGFNILIWIAPKDTNWDQPGLGVFWYFLGAIGAVIAACLGGAIFYYIGAIYYERCQKWSGSGSNGEF